MRWSELDYSRIGRETYGNICEVCSWGDAPCDVHHINYQEQQALEKKMREYQDNKNELEMKKLLVVCKKRGFLYYDKENRQLSKDDSIENLAVLCPNCHRRVHYEDMGKDLLNYINPRRKQNYH